LADIGQRRIGNREPGMAEKVRVAFEISLLSHSIPDISKEAENSHLEWLVFRGYVDWSLKHIHPRYLT
jgi:hypothetical protein